MERLITRSFRGDTICPAHNHLDESVDHAQRQGTPAVVSNTWSIRDIQGRRCFFVYGSFRANMLRLTNPCLSVYYARNQHTNHHMNGTNREYASYVATGAAGWFLVFYNEYELPGKLRGQDHVLTDVQKGYRAVVDRYFWEIDLEKEREKRTKNNDA